MTPLTVGSTFTGVGGADLGFEQAGFQISWQCELDAWKRSVLAAHWPDVQIFDDITTMLDPPPVDILIGGFPCQDLSVAGQRKGFTGERSVLAFEFLRLAESIRPRWLVLENVPGLLSSSQGADFARLIDEVVACGYGVAWRILDARYFGVPQRRRRVFIVARRTDALVDSPEASRLALRALRESGSGDIAPGWQAWQETARGAGEGAPGGCVCEPDPAGSLTKRYGKGVNSTLDDGSIVISDGGGLAFRKSRRAQTMNDDETWVEGDHANTLNSFDAGDVRTTHAIVAKTVSTLQAQHGRGFAINAEMAAGGQLIPSVSDSYYVEDCENAALRANGANDGPPRTDKHPLVVETFPIDDGRDLEKHQNGTGIGAAGDPAYTIDRQQRPAVVTAAFKAGQGASAGSIGYENEMAPTLTAAPSGSNQVPTIHTEPEMSVRRLTPTECERLMGWPDEWTAPEGVKAPDSKRYAACGDGIVAPVAFWIADRIRMIEGEA